MVKGMQKLLFMFIAILFITLLAACDDGVTSDIVDENKAKAKVSTKDSDRDVEEGDAKPKEGDPWTYYTAEWSDEFNGLEVYIEFVGVSDTIPAPEYGESDDDLSAVAIKFSMENTTEHKFTTFPDQATLVTSTGEQLEANLFESDSLGGDIDKGVIKEGIIVWMLERGEAKSIEWVKMDWYAIDNEYEETGDYSNMSKDFVAEIELK